MPEVAIRSANLADVPALVALMAEFYTEAGFLLPTANATRAFRSLLADPRLGGIWLSAPQEAGAPPAGYVVLTVAYSMEYGGLRGFVDDLYVRPFERGLGVAAALLGAVREACSARGVRALHVEVGPDNATARRVYARCGFVDSGHLLLTRALAAPVHPA